MRFPETPALFSLLFDEFPSFISYCSLNEVNEQCRDIGIKFTFDVQMAVKTEVVPVLN
jgi:hypothetical protein